MVEEQAVNESNETSSDILRETSTEQTAPPKKKKSLGFMSKLGSLRIPLLFIFVVILSITTALVITRVSKGNAATKQEQAKKEKKAKVGKFITLDQFTVNLAGGQNYLQVAIAIEIGSENTELEAEVKDRKPQINDTIISILSSKSVGHISDNAGREKLKNEIKKAVDSLLSYGKIERIYFTTFIMQ